MTLQEATAIDKHTTTHDVVGQQHSDDTLKAIATSYTQRVSGSTGTHGLSKHYVGTLICGHEQKLVNGKGCLRAVHDIVTTSGAQITGELLHDFSNGSYTLLIGLSESHISIHTWPERFTVQLDVFLCNYVHDNSEKCRHIYEEIVKYFDVIESNTTVVRRV